MTHSPLPWRKSAEYPFGIESDMPGLADGYDGFMVADCIKHSLCDKGTALANREMIVRAVNSHDALVKALDQVTDALGLMRSLVSEGGVPRYSITPGAALNSVIEEDVDPALIRARAALQAAKDGR